MAGILKDDVQTYVRKMILEEFGSNNNENKAPSAIQNQIKTNFVSCKIGPNEIVL